MSQCLQLLSLKIASSSTLELTPAMMLVFQNVLAVKITGSRLAWTASSLSRDVHFLGVTSPCLWIVVVVCFQLLNMWTGQHVGSELQWMVICVPSPFLSFLYPTRSTMMCLRLIPWRGRREGSQWRCKCQVSTGGQVACSRAGGALGSPPIGRRGCRGPMYIMYDRYVDGL